MELAYTLKDYIYIVIILGILTTLIFAVIRFKPLVFILAILLHSHWSTFPKFQDIFISQIGLQVNIHTISGRT